MKKRNLKSLQLNKNSISNLATQKFKGGRDSNDRQCYSELYQTVCPWVAGCESARRTLCC
jgi:hypothetical protein